MYIDTARRVTEHIAARNKFQSCWYPATNFFYTHFFCYRPTIPLFLFFFPIVSFILFRKFLLPFPLPQACMQLTCQLLELYF